MKLLKLLPIVFLFFATTVSADSKWYIGFGLGQATPKILLDEAVSNVELDIPEELGGGSVSPPILIDSKFETYGQKLFVGYDVGKEKRWALEGSYLNFGNYKGVARANVNVSGTTPERLPYTIAGSGEEEIVADIYGLTFSAIYSFRLGNRVSIFPRIGASYVTAKISSKEDVRVSIDVLGERVTEVELERDSDSLRGWLPVVGLGVDVRVGERHFIRTEFERYGHPIEKPYIDTLFVNWGYRFR